MPPATLLLGFAPCLASLPRRHLPMNHANWKWHSQTTSATSLHMPKGKHLAVAPSQDIIYLSLFILSPLFLFLSLLCFFSFLVVLLYFGTSLCTSLFLSLLLTHWVTPAQADGLRCSSFIWLVKFQVHKENRQSCGWTTTAVAAILLVVLWLSSALCCKERKWELWPISYATKPEHLIKSSSQASRWTWPPSTSHTEGRNTTGTSGDLQSAEYCPRLKGSHLLTNRLSVTSWHSLASSWHTNMACSKESAVSKKGYWGPNYFSRVNSVTFYRPEYSLKSNILSINTKHTCKHIHVYSTDTPTNLHKLTHTHTQPVLHLTVCSSPPSSDVPAWNSAELSWRAADGTGSLLLSFIEHYLFYLFCSTDVLLHVASLTAFSWNGPIFPSVVSE